METQFTVGQILQIAERLEDNGARFYAKMADRFGDPQRRQLCLALADWRAGRKRAFQSRRKQHYEREATLHPLNADDYIQTHPTVLADLTVFAERLYPPGWLSGRERPEEITRDAVAKTREAIAFYRGLKSFARDEEARAILDEIVAEEQCHIDGLSESSSPIRHVPPLGNACS